MMKRIFSVAALFAPLFIQPALADAPACNSAAVVVCSVPSLGGMQQSKPQAIPTSPTFVTPLDSYLDVIVVSTGGSSNSITVTDANGVSVLNAVAIAANTTYTIDLKGYWCPGGFKISAGSSGASFYARYRQ